jgi:hypothetical protein
MYEIALKQDGTLPGKFVTAARTAKIVGLTIRTEPHRGRGIDLHAANRIDGATHDRKSG